VSINFYFLRGPARDERDEKTRALRARDCIIRLRLVVASSDARANRASGTRGLAAASARFAETFNQRRRNAGNFADC